MPVIPGGNDEVTASVKVNAGLAISSLIGIIVSEVHTVLSVPKDELLVSVASGVGTIVKDTICVASTHCPPNVWSKTPTVVSTKVGEDNIPVIAYLLKNPPWSPNESPPGRGVAGLISSPAAFENSKIKALAALKSSPSQ